MLPQRPQRGHEEVVADADDRPLHPLGLARRLVFLALLASVSGDDGDEVVDHCGGGAVDLVDDEAVGALVAAVDGAHLRGRVELGAEGLERAVVRGVHLDHVVASVVGDHVRQRRLAKTLKKWNAIKIL